MSDTYQPAGVEADVSLTVSLPLDTLILFFDRIALHLPISAVMYLSQAHPKLMGKLSSHLRQSFDELLASRVSRENVDGFRTLLQRTRAAVSGSTVLHFILRDSHWNPGDFDLYAPFGTGYAIVHWLVKHEGYRIVVDGSRSFVFHPHTVAAGPSPFDWTTNLVTASSANPRHPESQTDDYDSTRARSHIYRVYKLCSAHNTFIDVIESSQPSFLPPITRFHSTIVMNYLTPNSLVVLYPKLTFRREGILQSHYTLDSYDNADHEDHADTTLAPNDKQDYIRKYKHRGFKLFSQTADTRRPCGAACTALLRMAHPCEAFYDRWALCIPILHQRNTGSEPNTPSPSAALDDVLVQVREDVQTSTAESVASPPSSAPSTQPPPPSSWTSSYVTDISAGQFSPQPSLLGSVEIEVASQHHTCTRPSLPWSDWTLQRPPLLNEGKRKKRRRFTCQNPYCPSSTLVMYMARLKA